VNKNTCICPPFDQVRPGSFWICPECGPQDG